MSGHSAVNVADAAKRIIAESENLSAKLIGAETRPSPTPLAETLATAQSFSAVTPQIERCSILDDLPHDIGSALSDSVLDGSDVIVCAGNPPDLEPQRPRHGPA